MDYRNLNARRIAETVERLRDRIMERFPQSNLWRVTEQLLQATKKAEDRIARINRPNLYLRTGIGCLVLMFVMLIALLFCRLKFTAQVDHIAEFFQGVDSALNTIILIGGAILFLFTTETRNKRKLALRHIHELRSLVHIVDMHQLTKDPDRILVGRPATQTSPERKMTSFEMSRYLSYCGELLSLAGKVAALYVERYDDPVVLSAVDQVEDLATGLSNKIWQKIMILDRSLDEGAAS
jgi:hypothetical protein